VCPPAPRTLLPPPASRPPPHPSSIQELISTAHSKLSYLRMVTPRVPDEVDAAEPVKRYVVAPGGGVEYAGAGAGAETDGAATRARAAARSSDASTFARHESNLRRFRFENRPGGPPRGPLTG
jgi:hypothetical protein